MMYEEALNAPTVFHLKKEMKDYISVLTNNIKKLVARDIRDLSKYYEPTDEIIEDILMSPLSELNEGNND